LYKKIFIIFVIIISVLSIVFYIVENKNNKIEKHNLIKKKYSDEFLKDFYSYENNKETKKYFKNLSLINKKYKNIKKFNLKYDKNKNNLSFINNKLYLLSLE